MQIKKLTFIGFGEAATAFYDGWGDARPEDVAAFDIDDGAARRRRCADRGLAEDASIPEALAGAEVVFSVVTADQALPAAQAAASHLTAGALWLDANSCAPETKRRAAEAITAAGGLYIDVAIMAPVAAHRHRTPLLIAGPEAEAAEQALVSLDMAPTIAGREVGQASAVKMIRSVMIKGLEALSAECFLAARRAGVDDAVITSLEASDPEIQWRRRGAYNLERMMSHGARRAAEMREAAATVRALSLGGEMSAAAAVWQDRVAAAEAASNKEADKEDLTDRADALLARL